MQLAWLVPSLLFGVYLGATTGQWQMIFMSAASATVWLAVRRFGWSGQFDFGQPIRVTDHAVYVRHALSVMRRHTDQFEWLIDKPQDFQKRPGGWPETRYETKARTVYGHEVWYFRFRRR